MKPQFNTINKPIPGNSGAQKQILTLDIKTNPNGVRQFHSMMQYKTYIQDDLENKITNFNDNLTKRKMKLGVDDLYQESTLLNLLKERKQVHDGGEKSNRQLYDANEPFNALILKKNSIKRSSLTTSTKHKSQSPQEINDCNVSNDRNLNKVKRSEMKRNGGSHQLSGSTKSMQPRTQSLHNTRRMQGGRSSVDSNLSRNRSRITHSKPEFAEQKNYVVQSTSRPNQKQRRIGYNQSTPLSGIKRKMASSNQTRKSIILKRPSTAKAIIALVEKETRIGQNAKMKSKKKKSKTIVVPTTLSTAVNNISKEEHENFGNQSNNHSCEENNRLHSSAQKEYRSIAIETDVDENYSLPSTLEASLNLQIANTLNTSNTSSERAMHENNILESKATSHSEDFPLRATSIHSNENAIPNFDIEYQLDGDSLSPEVAPKRRRKLKKQIQDHARKVITLRNTLTEEIRDSSFNYSRSNTPTQSPAKSKINIKSSRDSQSKIVQSKSTSSPAQNKTSPPLRDTMLETANIVKNQDEKVHDLPLYLQANSNYEEFSKVQIDSPDRRSKTDENRKSVASEIADNERRALNLQKRREEMQNSDISLKERLQQSFERSKRIREALWVQKYGDLLNHSSSQVESHSVSEGSAVSSHNSPSTQSSSSSMSHSSSPTKSPTKILFITPTSTNSSVNRYSPSQESPKRNLEPISLFSLQGIISKQSTSDKDDEELIQSLLESDDEAPLDELERTLETQHRLLIQEGILSDEDD